MQEEISVKTFELREIIQQCLELIRLLETSAQLPLKSRAVLEFVADQCIGANGYCEELGREVPRSVAYEVRIILTALGMEYFPMLENFFTYSHPYWKQLTDTVLSITTELTGALLNTHGDQLTIVCRYIPLKIDTDFQQKLEMAAKNFDFSSLQTYDLNLPEEYRPKKKAGFEDGDVFEDRLCAWCWESPEKLNKCSHCESVLYCGKECQRKHWKSHKVHCQSWAKKAQFEDAPV